MKVCLDTNIFISVKNKEPNHKYCEQILDAIDEGNIEAVISTVVATEVLVGFYMNDEEIESKKFNNHILLRYNVQPVTLEIADLAAKIRRNNLRLPDAIVIATTILSQSILITMDKNIHHPEIEILTPKQLVSRL